MIVTSQEHRSQHRNLEAAVARLEGMVRTASEVPRGPSELTLARIRALCVSYGSTLRINSHTHCHVQEEEGPAEKESREEIPFAEETRPQNN